MECKSNFYRQNFSSFLRINRYIMECKCIQVKADGQVEIQELIDTLWNVNSEEGEYKLISGEN